MYFHGCRTIPSTAFNGRCCGPSSRKNHGSIFCTHRPGPPYEKITYLSFVSIPSNCGVNVDAAGPELMSDSLAFNSALLDSTSSLSDSSRLTSLLLARRLTPFSVTGKSFDAGIACLIVYMGLIATGRMRSISEKRIFNIIVTCRG